jgi:hypothetical protein
VDRVSAEYGFCLARVFNISASILVEAKSALNGPSEPPGAGSFAKESRLQVAPLSGATDPFYVYPFSFSLAGLEATW